MVLVVAGTTAGSGQDAVSGNERGGGADDILYIPSGSHAVWRREFGTLGYASRRRMKSEIHKFFVFVFVG